jgi:signal transduction histidine kinase
MTDRPDTHDPAAASLSAAQAEIERLRRAERRKDEFLGQLAHEVGNILVPLPLALEILKQPSLTANTIERVREILQDQTVYIHRLISLLRNVSRLTRGIELKRRDFEFQPIAERAIAAVRPRAEARQHELAVSLPPEPVSLSADSDRLEQAITQVLDNAIENTESGGKIALSAARENGDLVIRVEDNGTGIAPELLPHVFEPFVRREPTSDWMAGRVGIGLALVRQYIELHGGAVTVESPGEGRGSTFTIRLPLT